MRIAILSTSKLPKFLGDDHPMEESLFAEDDLLVAELGRIGIQAERISWRTQNTNWSSYEVAIIRSTWDYIDSPDLFFDKLEEIENSGVRIINPLETVRWNSDKQYLEELVQMEMPVVPTCFLRSDSDKRVPLAWLSEGKTVVLKPTVGVGGFGVRTFDNPANLIKELSTYDYNCPLMAQPFLSSIPNEGEWSFVFGAGELLYSVIKKPAAGDYRVQAMYGSSTLEMTPSEKDLAIAMKVASQLPVKASLMRIDMARLPDGDLALMEAELIEPQLYLFDVPEAAKKLAGAIKNSLEASP